MNAPLTEKPEVADLLLKKLKSLRHSIIAAKHASNTLFAQDIDSVIVCQSCDNAVTNLNTAISARARSLKERRRKEARNGH